MQVGDLIRRAAQRWGDAVALETQGRTMSFVEFDRATDRLGNAILSAGLVPGDRVAVLLPNGIAGLVAFYALAKSGLVRVQLNTREGITDHEFKVSDSGARALIGDGTTVSGAEFSWNIDDLDRMAHDGDDAPCDVPRDAEAVYRLAYTGGTTGRPKAVMLTMRSEHAEITNYLLDLVPDIAPGDVMLHAAPVTHASGSFVLPHLIRGGRSVLLPRFDAGGCLEALQSTGAATTFLVPTMLARMLDEPNVADVETPALRWLCYGASPIAPTTVERAQELFGRVLMQTYGQAEAPMTISLLRPDEHDRVGSAGRPYTMVEVRVRDADGREVPRGEKGEICARGQILFSGYWHRPDATAERLHDGWLHTGDLGTMDDDGFLYLLDRKHDVIISGGFNVYPREVEDVLLAHPAVREAAVVSLADEEWGERVHAVVAVRGEVTPDDLLDWMRGRVAGYKRPRGIDIWTDLPKSPVGKILRRTVRDRVRSDATVVTDDDGGGT